LQARDPRLHDPRLGAEAGGPRRPPHPALLVGLTLLVFLIWGNSFIALSYLMGGDGAPARFDWVTLAAGRYVPAGIVGGGWCLLFRRRQMLGLIRRHPGRVALGGLLSVPAYAFALLFGQYHGVQAPIASLTTTLCPLFVIVLAAAFLGERLRARQIAGTALAFGGMLVIAAAGGSDLLPSEYSLVLAATVLAPLAWAIFTIVSKPVVATVGPLVWAYTTLAVGSIMTLPVEPLGTWRHLADLDGTGWLCLLFLILPCTTLGSAVWAWLLRHHDASIVGLTIFLNPPITTASKLALTHISPAFRFSIGAADWTGGTLVLVGLAVALLARRPSAAPSRSSTGRPPSSPVQDESTEVP